MEAMTVLLAIVVGALLARLFTRANRAEARLDHLQGALDRLHEQVRRDRAEAAKASSAAASAPPAPAPRAPAPVQIPVQAPPAAPPAGSAGAVQAPIRPPAPVPAPAPGPVTRAPAEPVPSATATTPSGLPGPGAPARAPLDWERFLGAKLYAWLGGFALFLGVAFFVKYSFDHDLVPPAARVALGFLTGLGLVTGGVVMQRREYAITSQTLAATGIVILYTSAFACHAFYHFTGPTATFLLMALVTVAAFALAVGLNARVVAVLGLLGGFLTPPLMSTGVDRPLGLFGYVALLDAGLLAVALRQRWNVLIALAAAGTALTEVAWAARFFHVDKVFVAMRVYLGFSVLFLAGDALAGRFRRSTAVSVHAAAALAFLALVFVQFLADVPPLSGRPGVLFAFAFGADLCLLALAWRHPQRTWLQPAAGGAVFLILLLWTGRALTPDLLDWALAACFGFALLHTVVPLAMGRWRPGTPVSPWIHAFPLVTLAVLAVPLARGLDAVWALWAAVLLVDLLAILAAIATATFLPVAAALVLTMAAAGVWLVRMPASAGNLPELLIVAGGFALLFFAAGVLAARRARTAGGREPAEGEGGPRAGGLPAFDPARLPALAAGLPFVLLVMAAVRLPLADPTPVFGLGFVLVVLLLGTARAFGDVRVVPIALAGAVILLAAWHGRHFNADAAGPPLAWYLLHYAAFTAYPFVFARAFASRTPPWAVAALAGPVLFPGVHAIVSAAYPAVPPGLIAGAFAVPMLLALAWLVRSLTRDAPKRQTRLALFGGSALFFITLVFPLQFERQWLTLAWALEGAALLWLFHRVPHRGLQLVGGALLTVAFGRLALNPAALVYEPRGALRILNWHLYTYGIVALCLMAAGRLTAPPRDRVAGLGGLSLPALFYSLGTVLAFWLMNIEIADFFGTEERLRVRFGATFAEDMTYSIAWALFALGLLLAGFRRRIAAARYAGLALLGVTLVKLFLHDLSRLAQLYRIGALVAVAVVLIVASFLYQRFLRAADTDRPERG